MRLACAGARRECRSRLTLRFYNLYLANMGMAPVANSQLRRPHSLPGVFATSCSEKQWLPSRGLPSDEKWDTNLSPIRMRALSMMIDIFRSNDWRIMLEMLQSKNLLQCEQCEYIRHQEGNFRGAAAIVLSIIEQLPAPSFENFCNFLQRVNGGMKLLAVLCCAANADEKKEKSEITVNTEPDKELESISRCSSRGHAQKGPIKKLSTKPTQSETKPRTKAKQTTRKSTLKKPRFPRANSALTPNMISAVSISGIDKWEEICSHLLSSSATAEIKEQHRSHMARLKACIEIWARKSKDKPTVKRLLDICELFGVSERFVKETYRSLP